MLILRLHFLMDLPKFFLVFLLLTSTLFAAGTNSYTLLLLLRCFFFFFTNFEISNELTSDFPFFFLFRGGGAGKIEGARASSHHHYHHHRHLHQRQKRYGFKKLFVFGDSYADTGNIQKSIGNSWKQPYGITFPGKPAGRFSDGRVLTDYVGTYNLSPVHTLHFLST